MQLLSIFSTLAFVSSVIAADRGQSTIAGLGARKQEILKAGGNTRDLAISMLETNNMNTDYTYGDGKSGDGTNFGIFKQNWYMLRHSASEFLNNTVDQVSDGAILNENLEKDIQARHEGEKHFGYETWFSGHRNGESGVIKPGTQDIKDYMNGVAWIQQQIESDEKYQSDDTRFWVNVKAI
ncbi:hypothetical protein N7537_011752 [Penicillium hordei]|uniref:Uncharacterized protein n=1 Tax=Penicillium hordei TaxID=40994 RepID=A0AAD6DNU7_9EURO|nr:uncharacterized protein N7537_011752 [Penicillium hordei]KAJ5589074.1 hypothetical protein N7537_011752 [Penicillium hordei]